MKLERQITSLELSKRLKELGVKQDTYFWWVQQVDEIPSKSGRHLPSYEAVDSWVVIDRQGQHGQESIVAFTVAELGEMLPPNSFSGRDQHGIICWRYNDSTEYGGATEAEARAKMLIYLLENKILTL
jgi:hypothetical protein